MTLLCFLQFEGIGQMSTDDFFFFNEMSPVVYLPHSLGLDVMAFQGVSQFAPWL